MSENQIIGVLIGTIYILGEVIKHRVAKKTNGTFSHEDRQHLYDLHQAHSYKDQDGLPLWYFPRKDQKETNTKLSAILEQLKEVNGHFRRWKCPYRSE